MRRTSLPIALLLAAAVLTPRAEAEGAALFADADSAFTRARAVAGNAEALSADEAAAAAALFTSALEQSPNARWELGLALVAFDARDFKKAELHAQRATELDPNSAEANYWLGNSLFSGINDAGLLEKGSIASKGRKAYERAVELDPNHVDARFSLAQFYIGAPGIAGGSNKKAKEQGEKLLTLDGGAVLGNLLLAQLAAGDDKWDEAAQRYAAAAAAAITDDDRLSARRAHASTLLRGKKDPKAALPLAESLVSEFPKDVTSRYLLGLTRADLKDYTGAVEALAAARDMRPESANILYALAEAQRDAGLLEPALASYDMFVTKHEKDKRASDAKSEAKKLRKKLAKK